MSKLFHSHSLGTLPLREAAIQLTREGIDAVIDTVLRVVRTGGKIRCKMERHGPHHRFKYPRWGIPPWRWCWMKHIQLICWIKGRPGSTFVNFRFPYGPCYQFRGGRGGVTHSSLDNEKVRS